ncbi:NAD(P)H dehydrogenase [Rhizobium sp. Leaf384]|uniref:NAD(P)H-dependent oxidoreductase n=1 Tax=Rhizobium sp. Leaf384 TaxID=1736358 RepID=UPI000715EEEE|nr:NAD(P)H-dependent oxidoreductase [Rhizobium sp. Leaf384]KQS75184.1 NAD(P)H dehydrogenase [Rhizobium sp. Leaf384]
MHILIVTAHPDLASYTHAAITRLVDGIESVPDTTHEILNLASSAFDPRFVGPDNDLFHGRGATPADVLKEQRRVDRAEALVLVFPVYWWSMPALMKGWIDRVFVHGWAFIEGPDNGMTRLLGRMKGHVVAIGGADRGTYERRGYLSALNVQIVQGIFGFCGMQTSGLDLLLPIDPSSTKDGLERAYDIGRLITGNEWPST